MTVNLTSSGQIHINDFPVRSFVFRLCYHPVLQIFYAGLMILMKAPRMLYPAV